MQARSLGLFFPFFPLIGVGGLAKEGEAPQGHHRDLSTVLEGKYYPTTLAGRLRSAGHTPAQHYRYNMPAAHRVPRYELHTSSLSLPLFLTLLSDR